MSVTFDRAANYPSEKYEWSGLRDLFADQFYMFLLRKSGFAFLANWLEKPVPSRVDAAKLDLSKPLSQVTRQRLDDIKRDRRESFKQFGPEGETIQGINRQRADT